MAWEKDQPETFETQRNRGRSGEYNINHKGQQGKGGAMTHAARSSLRTWDWIEDITDRSKSFAATGTIFDLMEAHRVTWADYFQDVPQGGSFRPAPIDPHFLPLPVLLAQLAGAPGVPPLA